jgi:hypothetical protein
MKLAAALAAVLAGVASMAHAQETVAPRISTEAVVSASMLSSNTHVGGMVDVTGTLRLGGDALLIARPWAWRRPDGTSTFQWYQLQLRYQARTSVPMRIDAGVITSPIGLNALQMRADLNPTISPVSYYVIPLPRFEPRFEGLQPLSAGYPLGAIVTASGSKWDARGGILDSTPARAGVVLKSDRRAPLPQVVAGAGFTPRAGFRVGAAVAQGRYRSDAVAGDGDATVFNLEAELTVNRTRLSGEWVADRFTAAFGTAVATSFYLQGVQTITPRIFGAARFVHVDTPTAIAAGRATEWTTAEATAGYRLTPQWTVRGGYFGQRPYFGEWDHQGAVSIVWAGRWWR